MIRKKFVIRGLHCYECVKKIEKKMKDVPGIEYIRLNFRTCSADVKYDPMVIKLEDVKKMIRSMGYEILKEEVAFSVFSLKNKDFVITLIGALLLIIGIYFMFFDNHKIYHYVLLASCAISGYLPVKRCISAFLSKIFIVDFLVVIASIGAILIDASSEAAAILILFNIAEMLEEYSAEKSRKSIKSLMDLSPKKVTLVKDGKEIKVTPDELKVGDVILVRPGERIGADGVVINGSAWVDQSPITGETSLIDKHVGDEVFAGSINKDGVLDVKVTKDVMNSTLAKIAEMVEMAEEKKSHTERFIDKFASYYTPVVILMAIVIATVPSVLFSQPIYEWIYKALVLLLISCPCALTISTPVSIATCITSAARNGVLFRAGVYVEKTAKAKIFAFDKTGTLTTGKHKVVKVISFGDRKIKEIISIAASLESKSNHPLANTIVKFADEKGIELLKVKFFKSYPGKGISGEINGKKYFVGSERIFSEKLKNDAWKKIMRGKTKVFVGDKNEIYGVILFEDELRDGVRVLIRDLRKEGIERIIMITGDCKDAADYIGHKSGIKEYYYDLLPEDKVEVIKKLKSEGVVVMVGDGINDAPALASADIGIAMGAIGSDESIQASDIALMSNEITKISYMIKLSKKAMRVVKQNIALSIGIKALFMILLFPGLITLWMAVAIGDMGVSFAVIMNAMRIR